MSGGGHPCRFFGISHQNKGRHFHEKTEEETLRKYVDFCDSGRPWYFALGVFVTLLIVQTALWFAADEDEKPSQWATLPAWFGIFQSIGCIRKARENRKQSAE